MVARAMVSFVDEHLASKELIRRLGEIKDLLRIRLGRLGLNETVEGLRPDFWEIKLRATDIMPSQLFLAEKPKSLQEMVTDLAAYDDVFSEHSLHSFEIYLKATTSIVQRLSGSTSKHPEGTQIPPDLDMPYDTILNFRKMPQWSFQYLSYWVESSLDLDIALFILMMHRQESVIPDPEEFIQFLRRSGEYYGAYAAVLDLWKIPDEDESQPIRNTKIIAASLRSKTDLPRVSYTAQELKMLLVGDEV